MTTALFSIGEHVRFRIAGASPDSRVLEFQLRRNRIDEDDAPATVTWYPDTATDPIPTDAVALSEDGAPTTEDSPHVLVADDGSWACYGEGHNFPAVFQYHLTRVGQTFIHAAGITFAGQGVAVSGRGGIGKSALAFSAFHDDRVKLLSDDILIGSRSGALGRYPTPHAIYDYHHPLLPETAQARFRTSKRQSLFLGPLYENALTRPVGRAAKRWLVTRGGAVGQQAARVRPHYVQVHSDEIFAPDQLVESTACDLFLFLVRAGDRTQTEPLSVERGVTLLLSAVYRELDLERSLSTLALGEALDLGEHWSAARENATSFLEHCGRRLHITIPRSVPPAEVQAILVETLERETSTVTS